jgi:sec-independent protein translocase protein TatB
MLGLSWSEIIIIAVVALVVVGPKDLPRAMRTAARWVRAGQKLAREFQGHVDELVREAELEELREKVRKAATEPLSSHIESMVDPGHELAGALAPPEALTTPFSPEPTIAPTVAESPAPAIAAEPPPVPAIEAKPVSEPAAARHDG